MRLNDLVERRTRLVAEMRALVEAPAGEGGDLSGEQQETFERMKGELRGIEQRIERQQWLDDLDRRAAGTPIAGGDSFESAARDFSLTRAIAGRAGLAVDDGREREISSELARRTGIKAQGILAPMAIFEKRVTTSTGDGAGLIPTDFRADQFIDLLRANLLTARLGATVLSGLSGNVEIPRRTGSVTAQWVNENEALTLTDAAFGQATLTPKHVGALTELSRNMLLQASPDIEQLTRADMAAVLAEAIDKAALIGSGAGAEPRGVVNTAGIGSFTLSPAPTWAEIVAAVADLHAVNAEGTGWAMHPAARALLRATPVEAGYPTFLMQDQGTLAGYPVAVSTILPTNLGAGTDETPVIFGAWADLVIGYWSALDVLVNPYAEGPYSRGNVQVRAMLTADVTVRHPQAFTVGQVAV